MGIPRSPTKKLAICKGRQQAFRNRQIFRRIDTHETIVAERFATFRYCQYQEVCRSDKCRAEASGKAAGVGGTNTRLPQQWVVSAGVVPTARRYRSDILPLGAGTAGCGRNGAAAESANRHICRAADTTTSVATTSAKIRHWIFMLLPAVTSVLCRRPILRNF